MTVEPLGTSDVFPAAAKSTYLDSASIALMHAGAARLIVDWQQRLADDGTAVFSERDEVGVFDRLAAEASRLFNTAPENIAGGSSETTLMASLAWGLMPPGGSTIVATDITHPSTVYPWMRVAEHTGAEMRWAKSENDYVDPDAIADLIDETTSVVCLSHVEYGTGQTYDLKRFADAAHAHGAALVVDATQSAGQMPIDVDGSGVDALATSCYKWLCGPFGTGFMALSPALQKLSPGIVGWRSHHDMWDFEAYRLTYADSAKRFEFGTMAYGTVAGAAEVVGYLADVGVERIRDHNRVLADMLIEGLRERGAEVLSPADPAQRSATVAARFGDVDSVEVAHRLKAENVFLSQRRDFLRFSPHLFNGAHDIERALAALGDL